ncbi:MAG: hypothetical protein ACXVRK_08940 [Gaiellaceae bacterium]
MSDAHSFRRGAVISRAADGSLVIIVRLTEDSEISDLEEVVHEARAFNARAIWVFGGSIDPALGFIPTSGYVRLEAPVPPAPLLLPAPPNECIRDLQTTCFAGIWGRFEAVSRDPASRYVGLYEKGRWVGICQMHVIERWIDGPGVQPMLRTPERSAQLVRGAAAYLPRNRPVTLETWGESGQTLEAYEALGFEVIERLPGWELRL